MAEAVQAPASETVGDEEHKIAKPTGVDLANLGLSMSDRVEGAHTRATDSFFFAVCLQA